MQKNKSIWFWSAGIFILVAGLLVYPRLFSNSNKSGGGSSISTDVPCLVPNIPLLQHIHPRLTILVDGQKEIIPANIGLGGCERAIHTHDETGELHVESQDRREYALDDFLSVWGKSIEREGYSLKVTLDGAEVQNPASLVFEDGQQILMEYLSAER